MKIIKRYDELVCFCRIDNNVVVTPNNQNSEYDFIYYDIMEN